MPDPRTAGAVSSGGASGGLRRGKVNALIAKFESGGPEKWHAQRDRYVAMADGAEDPDRIAYLEDEDYAEIVNELDEFFR